MWEDPIVAEVHRAREKLAAECNYDLRAFFAGLRQRQALRRPEADSATEAVHGGEAKSSEKGRAA